MVGVKEICALLLAGGIGAGTVVTVQKVSPPRATVAKGERKVKATALSAARRPASAPPTICVEPFMLRAPDLALQPLPEIAGRMPWLPSPTPDQPPIGGVLPDNPWAPPAVPEPGAWAMMIAGFGLVGMALRRRAVA